MRYVRARVACTLKVESDHVEYGPLGDLIGDSSGDEADPAQELAPAPGLGPIGDEVGPVVVVGGASGSGDAPPPPAPLIHAPRQELHPRGVADVVVHMHGLGKISYYARYDRFEAKCDKHPACRLTRGPRPTRIDPLRPSRGRPVGFMALWLLQQVDYDEKEEHHNPFTLALLECCMEERRAARRHVQNLPNGPELCRCERAQRPGEPEEGRGLP